MNIHRRISPVIACPAVQEGSIVRKRSRWCGRSADVRKLLRVSLAVMSIVVVGTPAIAQSSKFHLQVEVMMQPSPSDQLNAQKWGQLLFELNRRATFRQGQPGERTRVEEPEDSGQKTVKAVGLMNRNGTITFAKQTFSITQPERLEEWLNTLEQFGVGGPPNENATWGLGDEQLTAVLKLLAARVTEPVSLKSSVATIGSLQLPAAFRITFTDAARKRTLPGSSEKDFTDEFLGLTKGSVLAAALAQYGLGYRPKVDDNGAFFLEVDAGNESNNLFPVGWKNNAPITLVVPELVKRIEVNLDEEVALDGLIALIAERLKLPHAYSSFELAVAGQDLSKIKYSRKPDRLTLYNLIDIVGKTHHIGISLRTDESGNVFLWVTTEDEYNAFRERFAHVRPTP